MGNKWHTCALKENKYKTVLDLVYCFKYLTGSLITHPSLLCASSSSAGAGILAGAVNHKPYLLKAVHYQAPFLNYIDLLSDRSLPLSESDYEEFGDPRVEKEFESLVSICPYYSIKEQEYPAMLIDCYKEDYRTPVWHIMEYLERLKEKAVYPRRS